MKKRLVIGTRGSLLARTQSNWVAERLQRAHPHLDIHVEIITTKGDKILDTPLAKIGDKGLFTKELEVALLDGTIDLAIHSLKDLPTTLPEGLTLGAVPEREIPYDALIAPRWGSIDALPKGATVGTSSLRRTAQLLALRPDLDLVNLRGNIDTRIGRVQDGELDAAILACAGIHRLGRQPDISQVLDESIMIPAVAQGALGIEIRDGDADTVDLLAALHDPTTATRTTAERRVLAVLEGGCQVPLGAYATLDGDSLTITACVCALDGSKVLRTTVTGSTAEPIALGDVAAQRLIDQGAHELIAAIR